MIKVIKAIILARTGVEVTAMVGPRVEKELSYISDNASLVEQ